MPLRKRILVFTLVASAAFHLLIVRSLRIGAIQLASPQVIGVIYKDLPSPSRDSMASSLSGASIASRASGTSRASGASRAKVPSQRTDLSGSSRVRKIPLSSLVPKWMRSSPPPDDWAKVPGEGEFGAGQAWSDSSKYDEVQLSNGQGLSVEQANFVGALWRMIDQYIVENPFLSGYNHSGKAFFRFEVDESGRLLSLQAAAADRVLKVIAARAIRRAIQNDTGDLRFPTEPMVIHARFSWTNYQACDGLRGHRNRYLSFCHYAEYKRKSFSAGEKAATWAGAIYNHGPWAYEEIKKYKREEFRRNTQYNPFEEYERDRDWNL
jgi:hypothetical protein